MGKPHDLLIPAAILLDNPGITREEFARRLYLTDTERGVADFYRMGNHRVNCLVGEITTDRKYHLGLFGLAHILGLKARPQKVGNSEEDSVRGMEIVPRRIGGTGRWLTPIYRFIEFQEYRYGAERAIDFYGEKEVKPGEIIHRDETRRVLFRYKGIDFSEEREPDRKEFEVVKVDLIHKVDAADLRWKEERGTIVTVQRLRIREKFPVYSVHEFGSLEKAVREHPEYHPDNLFDFSQEFGEFYRCIDETGRWRKVGGKYYLDEEDLARTQGQVYSSIVLTAEAIKHRAWEVIGYSDYETYRWMLFNFLLKHPSTVRRHAAGVMNWWHSKKAAESGMNVREWLADRAMILRVDVRAEMQALRTEFPEVEEAHVKRIKREVEPQEDDGKPF